MLDINKLELNIQSAFDDILPTAFELALKSVLPSITNQGNNAAKNFGSVIAEQISLPLAKRLAAAIDYYIKSGVISGTIMTTGGPVMQTATLLPVNLGNPIAGSTPNTLGIV